MCTSSRSFRSISLVLPTLALSLVVACSGNDADKDSAGGSDGGSSDGASDGSSDGAADGSSDGTADGAADGGGDGAADGGAGDGGGTGADTTDDVLEIAIRRLNPGQDVGEFEAARDDFVTLLRAQPGVGTDREFSSFFDFSTYSAPTPPVFIGMTQYDNVAAYAAAGGAIGASAEAGAFFSTFTPEVFTLVVPVETGAGFDLAGVANGPGQVIEVVWRDLATAYPDFDRADYEAKRDAGIAALAAVDGVVAEYQWVAVEGQLAIGMTVYESAERFQAIATDPAVLGDPDLSAFFSTYPAQGGFVSSVVR